MNKHFVVPMNHNIKLLEASSTLSGVSDLLVMSTDQDNERNVRATEPSLYGLTTFALAPSTYTHHASPLMKAVPAQS
jgi:hypothetical protein